MFNIARSQAYKLVTTQIVIVVIIAILWWIFKDFTHCYSALLGGFAYIIPSWYFIRKLFANKKRTPQTLVRTFYLGELTKLLLSAILLVLIVKFIPTNLFAVLSGYIVACLSIWSMPFFIKTQTSL